MKIKEKIQRKNDKLKPKRKQNPKSNLMDQIRLLKHKTQKSNNDQKVFQKLEPKKKKSIHPPTPSTVPANKTKKD